MTSSMDPTTRTSQPTAHEHATTKLITGYWPSQITAAFANLSTPGRLETSELSVQEIAEREHADPIAVSRLLRASASIGLVPQTPSRYAETSMLATLTVTAPVPLRRKAQILGATPPWWPAMQPRPTR